VLPQVSAEHLALNHLSLPCLATTIGSEGPEGTSAVNTCRIVKLTGGSRHSIEHETLRGIPFIPHGEEDGSWKELSTYIELRSQKFGSRFISTHIRQHLIPSETSSKVLIHTTMAPNIPKEQWAQVIEKVGGPVEYKKIPVAEPGPGEVLVKIKYSGVCHTDLHAVNGDWPIPTKLPLVGGHEGAGIVVARGQGVTDQDAKIGEAVGVKWLNDSCLSCTFCQQADEPLCLTPKLSGYTVDGSFQQYAIASAKHVAHIPDGVPLDEVSPVLCAGITVYKGLKESGARPGQTVAIVGAGGGLGALAQQYARAMGLNVIAIDSGDEKKEMSMKMGASVS